MLGIVLAFLASLAVPVHKAPPIIPPVPAYLKEVLERWDVAKLDVTITLAQCGEINATYTPTEDLHESVPPHTIEMCVEDLADPDGAKFILNHELAHAYFDQHGLYLGWEEEFAADELASLMSTKDELTAAARFFLTQPFTTGDAHPADLDRAAAILCYLDGIEEQPASRVCAIYARSIQDGWTRTISLTL